MIMLWFQVYMQFDVTPSPLGEGAGGRGLMGRVRRMAHTMIMAETPKPTKIDFDPDFDSDFDFDGIPPA